MAAEDAVHVGNDMHRDVFGARELGLRTILFDSDQGTKEHPDTAPDHAISDHRELLDLLGLPASGLTRDRPAPWPGSRRVVGTSTLGTAAEPVQSP